MALSTVEQQSCDRLIELAIAEDLGPTGDRTSQAVISTSAFGQAALIARTSGVLAGVPVVASVCAAVDARLEFHSEIPDGTHLEPGHRIGRIRGPLRELLVAERTLLNFVQRLSGIATLTARYVAHVAGTRAVILDTRKTTPGWRLLEKYAVRIGGGTNHRIGLYDGILIKDNHLAGLGDPDSAVIRAVELARSFPGNAGLPVEIEVDTLEQLRRVLPVHPDIVLLDNMNLAEYCEAVLIRDHIAPATLLEASGGINLTTVRGVAETGVDRISVGALTHSATALDIGLDYESFEPS